MDVQETSEIRALAAPELDEVAGGLIEELAALVILGGTAFLFTAFSDSVAVKDGKVLINGIPQN